MLDGRQSLKTNVNKLKNKNDINSLFTLFLIKSAYILLYPDVIVKRKPDTHKQRHLKRAKSFYYICNWCVWILIYSSNIQMPYHNSYDSNCIDHRNIFYSLFHHFLYLIVLNICSTLSLIVPVLSITCTSAFC